MGTRDEHSRGDKWLLIISGGIHRLVHFMALLTIPAYGFYTILKITRL
jgi:hypothetical protein